MDFLNGIPVYYLALIFGTITFLITSLGSALVFLFKKINTNLINAFNSIAAGIMVAAAFFSLLNPAIELTKELKQNTVLICLLGFVLGTFLIYLGNIFTKKISKEKNSLLIFSITLHNIPEGLSIGVAFGSINSGLPECTLIAAISLALGIGIQNFPEGSAISLPLLGSGKSKFHSFIIGSLSAIVEPISALIGALLVIKVKSIMPLFLTISSAAMIFVAISELVPESMLGKNKVLMSILFMSGFLLMMSLDLGLG